MTDFQPGDIVTWAKGAEGRDFVVRGEVMTVLGPSKKFRNCVFVSGGSRVEGASVHTEYLVPVVPEAAAAADVPTVITGTTTKMVWSD